MSDEDGWSWVWDRFHGLDTQDKDKNIGGSDHGGVLGSSANADSPPASALVSPGGAASFAGASGSMQDMPLQTANRNSQVDFHRSGLQLTPMSDANSDQGTNSATALAAQGILGHVPDLQAPAGIPNVAQDDRWQALKDAAAMTADWAFGLGPADRTFRPGSIQVTEMMNAPGVDRARAYFYAKNAKALANGGQENLQPVTNYAAKFGLGDLLTNGSPTQQFVGSYGVDIKPSDNGAKLQFKLTNDSSFKSFGYGLAPAWERGSFRPGGNMQQTYTWSEPVRQK